MYRGYLSLVNMVRIHPMTLFFASGKYYSRDQIPLTRKQERICRKESFFTDHLILEGPVFTRSVFEHLSAQGLFICLRNVAWCLNQKFIRCDLLCFDPRSNKIAIVCFSTVKRRACKSARKAARLVRVLSTVTGCNDFTKFSAFVVSIPQFRKSGKITLNKVLVRW